MKMTQLALVASVVALSGCSTTPMDPEAYAQMMAGLNQGNAALAAQNQQVLQNVQNQAQPMEPGQWEQDRSTTLVYCKELGRYVVSCDVRE